MATLRGARRRLRAAAAVLAGRTPGDTTNRAREVVTADGIVLKDEPQPRVSILIPVFGELATTLNCLRSLAAITTSIPFEVVILDDATPTDDMSVLSTITGLRYHRSEQNRGFLLNVNWGADFARGDILLLLNNDTIVDKNFLDPLIEAFDTDPMVGAVGSLLLYPTGVVQEAGGIIWNDATGWNYGRHNPPGDSRDLWTREVDYCSGASLAVRRDLWRQLGGFDATFAPAYYEDTDLCFAIRELGYRVMFEPRSKVVHLEGVSHGTDETSGVKQHQTINRERFLEKWGHRLVDHCPPHPDYLFDARSRHRGPRVAVIDHILPEPRHDSGSVRMTAIVEQLHRMGFLVHFIPLNLKAEGPLLQRWQQMGIEVFYGDHDVVDTLRQLGRTLDVVVMSRLHVATKVVVDLRHYFPQLPLVYDMVDAHGLRAQREAELSGDPSLRRVARTDTALELGLCRAADLVVAVSPDEAALMRSSIDDEVRIEVLPNIHQSERVPEGCAHRTGVVFVGGYRHTPNVDAALWMTGEILPLLEPDVTLTLAGSYVVPEVSALANDRVVVPGWIDDLTPLYDSARVVVAPLRYGAGVKGKIGEALAHGVPVVTTSIGAEGMHLVHGENALIADTPQAFAAAVNQLIHDDELWLRLSSAGRAHVAHHFGPEAAERALRRIIEAVGIDLPGASD